MNKVPEILPKMHYPIGLENRYKKLLLSYTRHIKSLVVGEVLPRIKRKDLPSLYSFDDSDDLDEILESIEDVIVPVTNRVTNRMRLLGLDVIQVMSRNMDKSVVRAAPNFAINIFGDATRGLSKLTSAWVDTNTRLIKSIPVELLDDVALVINRGFSNGSTIKVIQDELKKRFDISNNRARLIARDQIAKLSSNIIRHESLAVGFDLYIWVTANDDRVRASHRVLNQKVCSWNDPTIYKDNISDKVWKKKSSIGGVELGIGQDFQCRCSPKPIKTPR